MKKIVIFLLNHKKTYSYRMLLYLHCILSSNMTQFKSYDYIFNICQLNISILIYCNDRQKHIFSEVSFAISTLRNAYEFRLPVYVTRRVYTLQSRVVYIDALRSINFKQMKLYNRITRQDCLRVASVFSLSNMNEKSAPLRTLLFLVFNPLSDDQFRNSCVTRVISVYFLSD